MGFPVLIGIRPGASEDVSFFLNEVPGLYFNLGIVPRDQDLPKAAPNHSPGGALLTGGLSSADRHSSCYAHARARASATQSLKWGMRRDAGC